MKKIETSVLINASAERVWNLLMDAPAYPEWNPFIQQLEGTLAKGETIKAKIQPPGKQAMIFKPIVLVCDTNKEFRWIGKLMIKGLFDGEHFFKLEAINAKQTKLIHGEQFSGLLTGILLAMIAKATKEGFHQMNEALKARAEKEA